MSPESPRTPPPSFPTISGTSKTDVFVRLTERFESKLRELNHAPETCNLLLFGTAEMLRALPGTLTSLLDRYAIWFEECGTPGYTVRRWEALTEEEALAEFPSTRASMQEYPGKIEAFAVVRYSRFTSAAL